jgi:hypothetical protein
MKKTILNTMWFSVIALLLVSCGDDFLVEEPTGNEPTIKQIGEAGAVNPEINGAFMTGVYSTMFTTGTGGTGSQSDFGQKGFDIYSDMLTGDIALTLSTYGWYRAAITEFQAPLDFTQQENYQGWRYYYRVINRSNLVIETVLQEPQPEEEADLMAIINGLTDENRHIVAQAFAMRAHSYFNLTQLYINDVTASWNSPTLPIYVVADLVGNEKSTTEAVYQLIEDDLTRAISLMDDFSRPSKVEIDKPVAETILAYVLASHNDNRWTDVVALTNSAMSGSPASLMTADDSINGILGGFNDVNASGWMWGIDLNVDIGLGLVSWWGQMDAFSYSYAAVGDNKAMDQGLYDSMRADDIRRNQFLDDPLSTRNLQPLNKFFDSDRIIFGSSQIVKADYIYMRYAEPLLLNIEALYHTNPAGAKTALKDFAQTRIDDVSYIDALNGQALLDEIYKQTRLELWGEGKSYYAMKRNKATTVRGDNHLTFVGEPIPWNDERMTLEIPLQEIQDNLFINDQN